MSYSEDVVLGLAGMASCLVVVWLICKAFAEKNRAQYFASWDNNSNVATPPMFERMLEKAMTERDTKQRQLEERIVVLEKIVTDTNKSASLANEIDRLRSDG